MSTLADLEPGTTLVTVNNRLSAELRGRYDALQASAGASAWHSPDILPWNAWLQRQYQSLLDTGFTVLDLLSPHAERLLWEAAIVQPPASGLLRPAAAADMARQAFALCREWQLDRALLQRHGGDDTRAFLGWWSTVQEVMDRQRLLGRGQLPGLLCEALEAGALEPPLRLVHAGFDTLSPAQRALFELLGTAGCLVEELAESDAGTRLTTRQRVEAADPEHEIRLAATWVRDHVEQHPDHRVGVVSTRLEQHRADLERVFGEILAPHAFLGEAGQPRPFNISLGEPLAGQPMVAHALLALRLLASPLTMAEAGQLLRSPFLGGHAAEWQQRALFDLVLRGDGLPRLDLGRLHFRLRQRDGDDPAACPDLLERLAGLRELRGQLPSSATPSQWAGHLQAALTVLGWPAPGLDSREYQQQERMQRLLSDFAALAKVRPRMTLREALAQFAGMAADTVFQPQSAPCPVQILGGLEAAGMAFDALWLIGMDDQAWPPAAQPNPLIPVRLQREQGMPHASAERELDFAGRLTERLAGAADRVIASHARMDAEREQQASPLTVNWPVVDAQQLVDASLSPLYDRFSERQAAQAMALPAAGSGPVRAAGGAALLAAHAACPFAALARFRLQAKPLDEATFAPDGALVGNMLHDALRRLWEHLQDSGTLARYEESALQALVRERVTAVLADFARRRPDLFTERFQAIETDRLTRLLMQWLACERERGQAFEVVALEQDREIPAGPLTLRTRADRVDRLADGSLAIIDYKSGRQVGITGWFDDRLSEPQLPLYTVAAPGEVGAALLARVRRDGPGCTFVGLSRKPGLAAGVTTPEEQAGDIDWQTLLQHWRQSIDELADEIASGRADPTPSQQACRYCALGALCRVRDMLAEADDD